MQYESIDTTPRLARRAFTEGTGHLPQHNKQLDRCKRIICRCYPLRNSTTTEHPNAYGTPQSPRLNEGQQKVNICSWCLQGSFEKRCIGQDEEGQRQEEGPQEAPCASPQAQGRDREALREQPTAPGRTESVKACGLSDMAQLHDELVQGNCLFKWGQGTGNV